MSSRNVLKPIGLATAVVSLLAAAWAWAHPMMGQITWNRQISRIVYDRCVECHRDGGTSFSLLEYAEARQAAEAIKRTVLARSMPPWGAVKGFGELRDEQGLSESQIEMIVEWVDGGTARGNNPRALPERPKPPAAAPAYAPPRNAVRVSGELTLERALKIAGLFPRGIAAADSAQIVAALPNGSVLPLVWLYGYRDEHAHAFWLEKPVELPAGTAIRGVPPTATVFLLPSRR